MVNYRTAQRRCQVPVLGKGFCCHSEEHHGDESHVYAPCLSRKTLRAYADPCVFRRLRNRAPACSSTLRCPENAAGLRFSLHSPTAAEIANLLLLPLAAQVRNSTGSGRGSVILSEPLGASRRIFSFRRGKILRLRGFAFAQDDRGPAAAGGIAGLRCRWQKKQARNFRSGRRMQGSA